MASLCSEDELLLLAGDVDGSGDEERALLLVWSGMLEMEMSKSTGLLARMVVAAELLYDLLVRRSCSSPSDCDWYRSLHGGQRSWRGDSGRGDREKIVGE